jgi:hypothetical protein
MAHELVHHRGLLHHPCRSQVVPHLRVMPLLVVLLLPRPRVFVLLLLLQLLLLLPHPLSVHTAAATPTPSGQAESTQHACDDGTLVVIVDDNDNVPVGGKRKHKSEVWLEFVEIVVGGKVKAECNWCKKLLAGSSRDGTNHLRSHLKSCASHQARKGLKQATLKLGKDGNGAVVVEKYAFDQQVARKELALMICILEYPLSMVDHVGFRRFCSTLQPLFKHVSRNTIKKDILDMYEVYKLTLISRLQKCSSRIAITTDMWTANHQRKGYMAMTVHFVDDDWKLKSSLKVKKKTFLFAVTL